MCLSQIRKIFPPFIVCAFIKYDIWEQTEIYNQTGKQMLILVRKYTLG